LLHEIRIGQGSHALSSGVAACGVVALIRAPPIRPTS